MAVLKKSHPGHKRFQYSGGKQKQKLEKKTQNCSSTECTIRVGHGHATDTKIAHSNPWLNAVRPHNVPGPSAKRLCNSAYHP